MTMAADVPSRTLAINVTDANGQASADASVIVRTNDGQMTHATPSGMIYAVKNVGEKVTIAVTHPQYGLAIITTELPMIDPVYVEITFTGQNRAYLTQLLDEASLGSIAPRVSGLNQIPGAAEGPGCAGCIPIGEGTFAGNSCGNSEPT